MNDGESGTAKSGDGSPRDSRPAGSEPTTSAVEARMQRLLQMLLWVGDHDVAQGLRSLSPGELALQPLAIRTALQSLRRKRDPASFLAQPQYRPTVPLISEAVAEACQNAVISALGDAADDPDRAQLLSAIEAIRSEFAASTIALMLAFVSVTNMSAADLCDEILQSEELFKIPAAVAPPDANSKP